MKVGRGHLLQLGKVLKIELYVVVLLDILYTDRHDSIQFTSLLTIHNANVLGIKIGTGTILQVFERM